MLDLGFRELSLEPVVCSPEEPYALTDRDFDLLVRQYEELAELSLEYEKNGDPFNFYHYMIDLEHGPCIHKKLAGCASDPPGGAILLTGQQRSDRSEPVIDQDEIPQTQAPAPSEMRK